MGAFVDKKITGGSWGDKVVDEFAFWLKEKDISVKNFDRRNIYRMREFFVSWHNVNWSLGFSGFVQYNNAFIDNEQANKLNNAK